MPTSLIYISERSLKAQEDYSDAHNFLMQNPHAEVLKQRVHEARTRANFLMEAERQFMQQRLKNKHLCFVHKNTKYFHSLVKHRNLRSSIEIAAISKSNGTITTSQVEIVDEFINYFANLLGFVSKV